MRDADRAAELVLCRWASLGINCWVRSTEARDRVRSTHKLASCWARSAQPHPHTQSRIECTRQARFLGHLSRHHLPRTAHLGPGQTFSQFYSKFGRVFRKRISHEIWARVACPARKFAFREISQFIFSHQVPGRTSHLGAVARARWRGAAPAPPRHAAQG